jgi:hypothetical protein
MKTARMLSMLVAVAGLAAACATQKQQLNAKQNVAIQTALERGRFDLNCQAATATVLSRDSIQPAIQGPWVSGLQRVEYTIGIAGCNQRKTYIVIRQEGTDTCFAANPEARGR